MTSATDAKGNVTTFEYDIMDNLSKVTLHRVDEQDKVDEYEVTLYEYDGRGLQTKVVDALGNITVHEFDGNWNLVKTIDADGYVTEYTMDALDLIEHINYNGGKQVDYAYNKTGDLVKMEDWSGTTTYEVDLLHQITATTDRLGNHVAYTYDGVGNQTSVSYPDGTVATKEYDLVHNLTTVIEEDGRTTTYEYDGMRRVTHMNYPDGWQEDYHYDSIARQKNRPLVSHHIVAGGSMYAAAQEARRILQKFGISINSAVNGVFLPTEKLTGVAAMYHHSLHTHKYYDTVLEMLQVAESAEDVTSILGTIKKMLLAGTFPI